MTHMANLTYLCLISNGLFGKVFVILDSRKLQIILMQYSFRFFVSWIISAVLMYAAFYFWHGVFLNDLNNISFSKTLFLLLAALVYLVISYVLYRVYEMRLLNQIISSTLLRGIAAGVAVGFTLFATVTVLGISFTKHMTMTYMLADCLWQMTEQVLGGIIIAIGKAVLFEPKPEEA